MRFKAFLNEGIKTSYKQIPKDTAIQLAKQYFTEAFSHAFPYIIRGMSSDISKTEDFYYISNIENRTSAHTSNEYTVLIDNLKAWEEYPKRSKSLICTTVGNFDYVTQFGDTFIILPKIGAKIGVCPSFDFWDSFPIFNKAALSAGYVSFSTAQLSMLNDVIRGIFKKANFTLDRKNTDFLKLKQAFDAGTKLIRDNNSLLDPDDRKFFLDVFTGKKTMFEFVSDLLDPNNNGFKLTNYSLMKKISEKRFEIWIEGPALAIGSSELFEYENIIAFYQNFRNEVLKNEV